MSEAHPEALEPAAEADSKAIRSGKVLVTGGSGFVGRYVVRELAARGYQPVCLVRDPHRLQQSLAPEQLSRTTAVRGDLSNPDALAEALDGCVAVVHLVGIIMERRLRGQTFQRVHVEGTRNMVTAAVQANIRRFVHMSALGTRSDAVSPYHQTKWAAEQLVRSAPLDWTIFRPSLIHGPDGEFMQMMKFFSTSKLRQPFMPYFGDGTARMQPVDVRDVATCFVRALALPDTIGKIADLVGPERFSWKDLYDTCALAIAGHKRLKVPVSVGNGKLAARFILPLVPSLLVPFKFDVGQVDMSQEDSISDPEPIERHFGVKLRDFRTELRLYADRL